MDYRQICRIALILLFQPKPGALLFSAEERDTAPLQEKITENVREFSGRLGLAQKINISIETNNPRLASMQRDPADSEAFRMSFDADFLLTLDDGELTAVIAHELGHLWIYTHFPFLQTEFLANQQALKLVPRRALVQTYGKVRRWKRNKEGETSFAEQNTGKTGGPSAANESAVPIPK